MKKTAVILAVVMMVLCIYAPVSLADAIAYDVEPVNLYVYVATPDGGLNMRVGPGVEYSKVMKERIPDGVQLYITQKSGSWGYTSYNGNYGWVSLTQTTTKAPKPSKEPANYYVYVATPDGGLNMRVGPGVEYGKVMKERIPDGVKLHITQKSGSWGYTSYNGSYGWVSLTQTTIAESEPEDTEKHDDITQNDADDKANEPENTGSPQATANPEVPVQNNSNANGSLVKQIVLIAIILILVIVIAILAIIVINSKTKK